MFIPRPYQTEAINAGVSYFTDKKEKKKGMLILPTGSGKSIVIANITGSLPPKSKSIVLQPSIEILVQNFRKYTSYGYRAGIYSASAGIKHVDDVCFATIGSIIKKKHLFQNHTNILIDECHKVNADDGMYQEFIHSFDKCKVLGLTATPYRLESCSDGSMLKFLNRTNPRIFNKVLYHVQNDILFKSGHLAPLEYYSFKTIDRGRLELNKTGSDFTDASIKQAYAEIDMPAKIIHYANRILKKRKSLLVFCTLNAEAFQVAAGIPGARVVTGDTDKEERKDILKQFTSGVIPCVVNCKVLDTGFDYDKLEAVLIGRSTMSMALYYQMIGRVMRPYKYSDGSVKSGWVVDLGDNIRLFGKIETMQIQKDEGGLYSVWNNINGVFKQLTNVTFRKN